jgi:hypothetical protein
LLLSFPSSPSTISFQLAIVRDLLALRETAAFRLGASSFFKPSSRPALPLLPKIGIVERSVWRLLWLLLVESAGDTCNCEPDQCSADNSTGNPQADANVVAVALHQRGGCSSNSNFVAADGMISGCMGFASDASPASLTS